MNVKKTSRVRTAEKGILIAFMCIRDTFSAKSHPSWISLFSLGIHAHNILRKSTSSRCPNCARELDIINGFYFNQFPRHCNFGDEKFEMKTNVTNVENNSLSDGIPARFTKFSAIYIIIIVRVEPRNECYFRSMEQQFTSPQYTFWRPIELKIRLRADQQAVFEFFIIGLKGKLSEKILVVSN